MNPSPTHAAISPPACAARQSNSHAEHAYRALTIAAMLLIIASLVSFW